MPSFYLTLCVSLLIALPLSLCDELARNFLDACKSGKMVVIEKLLKNAAIQGKVEANVMVDDEGMTPLLYATGGCHYHVVEALLVAGGNPTLTANNGTSPLSLVSRAGGCPAVLELLLRAGVEPDQWVSQAGVTCLMLASGFFPPGEVAQFARSFAEQRLPPSRILTLFGAQARESGGDSEDNGAGVRHLLAFGANPDAKDKAGNTALHYAAMAGRKLAVEALLEGGADYRMKGAQSYTPFRAAILFGHLDIVKTIYHFSHNATAVENAHAKAVARAATAAKGEEGEEEEGGKKKKKKSNATTPASTTPTLPKRTPLDIAGGEELGPDGTSPLFLAGSGGMVDFLMSIGADPSARDSRGGSALMAVHDAGAAGALIAGGTPVNALDAGGATALHWQAGGSPTIVEALLTAGANPNAVDSRGETPLMHSLSKEVTDLLLRAGADATVVDGSGRGALMRAGSEEQALALIDRGADPAGVDATGRNGFFYAASPAILKVLVDAKVPYDVKDKEGLSPLAFQAAGENPDPEVLEILARLLNTTVPARKGKAGGGAAPPKAKTKAAAAAAGGGAAAKKNKPMPSPSLSGKAAEL